MRDWIREGLSEEQLGPLGRKTRNCSILAAAGSGKTRTLVHSLAHDLISGIPASQIVAFTFTEKAAHEILARVHSLMRAHEPDLDLAGLYLGTIHSWCLNYLLEHEGFYNFQPIDELHLDSLISRLYDSLDIDRTYNTRYPRGIEPFTRDLELYYNELLDDEELPPRVSPALRSFMSILRQNRLLTFGGMIREAVFHLRSTGPIDSLSRLYIDEYQDVNPAQVELVRAMTPKNCHITVVGDDLQCIFQWRGSDVLRILDFSDDFGRASVHRLTSNYRSRPEIVNFANSVASHISIRDAEKVMIPNRSKIETPHVHWLTMDNDEDQARVVAEIIANHYSQGVPYSAIAILLRSVLGWGQPFVDALSDANIPVDCPLLSRGGDFLDGFLSDLLDWLRKTKTEPANELQERELVTTSNLLWSHAKKWVPDDTSELLFWEAVSAWDEVLESRSNAAYNVRECLYTLFDQIGIRIDPSDGNLMVGVGIASQIVRSVEEVHRRRLYQKGRVTPRKLISEVYHALKRYRHRFGESVSLETVSGGVLISTVHQAKGLEWPIVILPMVMSRRFPLRTRQHGTSFPDHIAQRYGTTIQDERRLFYVASTRARERLYLLDSARNSKGVRSIFRRELEAEGVVRPLDIKDIHPDVWQIAREDLEEADPPPISIGLSDLLLYVECPFQFGLRRVAGIQPAVGDELGFGKSLHELIQRRYGSSAPWDDEELELQTTEHVFLPLVSDSMQERSRQVIRDRLAVLEKLRLFEDEVQAEVDVEVVIGGHIVHGTVDSVILRDDGEISIRDWKSGFHDCFLPRYTRQLRLYAYALRERGYRVHSAAIVDVAATAESESLVTREVDVGQEAIDASLSELRSALDGIAREVYLPMPSVASCSCCDLYKMCPARLELLGHATS